MFTGVPKATPDQPRIEYVPPSDEILNQLARDACAHLALSHGSTYQDPDVVALVANDLSRLHRKGWRIGDLLDFVEQHEIKLVLADPRRQIDFSTPYGRMFAQLSAIFDEWYAIDVSQRCASAGFRQRRICTVTAASAARSICGASTSTRARSLHRRRAPPTASA